MKKITLNLLVSAILLMLPFSLSANEADTKAEIEKIIYSNAKALEDENIDAYMEHIAEPLRPMTAPMLKQLFEIYDLKYEIESVDVKVLSDDTLEATVVQVTKKVEGPEFKDNKGKFKHTMKKKDGKWFFEKTDVISIEFL